MSYFLLAIVSFVTGMAVWNLVEKPEVIYKPDKISYVQGYGDGLADAQTHPEPFSASESAIS